MDKNKRLSLSSTSSSSTLASGSRNRSRMTEFSRNEKEPPEIPKDAIYKKLMEDPATRAMVLQLITSERANNEEYKREEARMRMNTPTKKVKRKYVVESPVALLRRRAREQRAESPSSDWMLTPSPTVPYEKLMDGVVAFIDVKSKNEDRSAGVRAVMRSMGAEVKSYFSSDVTHVVFKDGSFRTSEKAKLLRKHLVSVLWVEMTKKGGVRASEKHYPALGTDSCNQNASKFCEQLEQDYKELVDDELSKALQPRNAFQPRRTGLPLEFRAVQKKALKQCELEEDFTHHSSQDMEVGDIMSRKRPLSTSDSCILSDSDSDSCSGVINGHSFSRSKCKSNLTSGSRSTDEEPTVLGLNLQELPSHNAEMKSDIRNCTISTTTQYKGDEENVIVRHNSSGDLLTVIKEKAEKARRILQEAGNSSDILKDCGETRFKSKSTNTTDESPKKKAKSTSTSTCYKGDEEKVANKNNTSADILKTLNEETHRILQEAGSSSDSSEEFGKTRCKSKFTGIIDETPKKSKPNITVLEDYMVVESDVSGNSACDEKNVQSVQEKGTDKNVVEKRKESIESAASEELGTYVTKRRTLRNVADENFKQPQLRNSLENIQLKPRLSDTSTVKDSESQRKASIGSEFSLQLPDSNKQNSAQSSNDMPSLQISVGSEAPLENGIKAMRKSDDLSTMQVSTASSTDNKMDDLPVVSKTSFSPVSSNNNSGLVEIIRTLESQEESSEGLENEKLKGRRKTMSLKGKKSRPTKNRRKTIGGKRCLESEIETDSDNSVNKGAGHPRRSGRLRSVSKASLLNETGRKSTRFLRKTEKLNKSVISEIDSKNSSELGKPKNKNVVARTPSHMKGKAITEDEESRIEESKNKEATGTSQSVEGGSDFNSPKPDHFVTKRRGTSETPVRRVTRCTSTALQLETATPKSKSKTEDDESRIRESKNKEATDTSQPVEGNSDFNFPKPDNFVTKRRGTSKTPVRRVTRHTSTALQFETATPKSNSKTAATTSGSSSESSSGGRRRVRRLYNPDAEIDEDLKEAILKSVQEQDARKCRKKDAEERTTKVLPSILFTETAKKIMDLATSEPESTEDESLLVPIKPKPKKRRPAAKKANPDLDEQKDLLVEVLDKKRTPVKTKPVKTKPENFPITPQTRRSTMDFQPVTPTPKKSQRTKGKPDTIVCTRFKKADVKIFQDIVKKLGRFETENQVTKRTTHLVVAECTRTINVLKAIARGIWVLKKEWLYSSLENGKWLPEENYELTQFSPAVQQCRIERETFGSAFSMDIFEDCGPIYVTKSTRPPCSDLEELIGLCKGKLVALANKAEIVVGEYLRFEGMVCVSELWVLDSVTQNKCKNFAGYLLEPPVPVSRRSDHF